MARYDSILGTVGNTPVVRINRLAPEGVNLFVKMESFHPLSSVKDRLALGVIDAADADAIAKGLAQVKGEIEAGTFAFSRALEDIHMNVESRLGELIGPAAGRLHTARSRNDQVATDFRLWVRDWLDAVREGRTAGSPFEYVRESGLEIHRVEFAFLVAGKKLAIENVGADERVAALDVAGQVGQRPLMEQPQLVGRGLRA